MTQNCASRVFIPAIIGAYRFEKERNNKVTLQQIRRHVPTLSTYVVRECIWAHGIEEDFPDGHNAIPKASYVIHEMFVRYLKELGYSPTIRDVRLNTFSTSVAFNATIYLACIRRIDYLTHAGRTAWLCPGGDEPIKLMEGKRYYEQGAVVDPDAIQRLLPADFEQLCNAAYNMICEAEGKPQRGNFLDKFGDSIVCGPEYEKRITNEVLQKFDYPA